MKYEEFIKDIKRGIEGIVKEKLEDGVVVIRNVMKNNSISMKAVSIMRKGENATPTIYLKEYFREYKMGRSMESICREIFEVYNEGIHNFKQHINVQELSDFEKIKGKIFYRLINYEMNEKLLRDLPHFKFLDMAIIFYIMVHSDEKGQATALIHRQHVEGWKISDEELQKVAFANTWEKFPAVIQRMEDIISEMIMEELLEDDEEEGGEVMEEIQYGRYSYDEVANVIKEEVANIKADREIDMYVLTNNIRFNGAACMTYPGVLKEFAREHQSDISIIPSSVHEVILIPGTGWEKEKIDEMISEVNEKELDPVEILSDHVYIYSREKEEILY